MKYDASSKSSIMAHALTILGKSLRELYPNATSGTRGGKGNFGNDVEFYHFERPNNSNPEPDFGLIGYDLKCTPLDPSAHGYVAGERLVITMIDFINEAKINHYTESHFWEKAKMLLIFYLRIKGSPYLDYIVQMIRWWNIPEEDLKIIIDDWNKIHDKLVHGLAHELSEGDTLYLGACTKSSDSSIRRPQFAENAPEAKPRAYCLKKQYMNWLVVDSFLDKRNVNINPSMNLTRKYMERIIRIKRETGVVVKSIDEYEADETFEDLVIRRFAPYYGKTLSEISQLTGIQISDRAKDFAYQTCLAILGVKGKKIEEFEKAGILLKSVSLQHDMKSLKESMSFTAFKYLDVATEDNWEDSGWYETITSRFFFVIFQKSEDGDRTKLRLRKVFFWGMPVEDQEECKVVWQDTRNKILNDVFDDFMGMADNPVCHVRPHALNNNDTYPTPSGRNVPKKCFWLHHQYILNIVLNNLKQEKVKPQKENPLFLIGCFSGNNQRQWCLEHFYYNVRLDGKGRISKDEMQLVPNYLILYQRYTFEFLGVYKLDSEPEPMSAYDMVISGYIKPKAENYMVYKISEKVNDYNDFDIKRILMAKKSLKGAPVFVTLEEINDIESQITL